MKNQYLKICPIGGIGQIGSNMTLIQGQNDVIIIDAGILFPYEDFFDINYLIPDLSELPTPSHLIITHGHEDHIGAVYHIIKKFPNIIIWASSFAAHLIKKRLDSNHNPYPVNLFHEHDQLSFVDFTIDPIHVNHSIPETFGLLIRDRQDKFGLFYISDFKIDFKTTYEPAFDFKKLIRLSKDLSTKVLLADSTNITSETLETPSEFDIIPVIDDIFKKTKERIFITSFPSNIHRLITFLTLCKKHQRIFVAHGRSILNYIDTATELGMISNFQDIIKPAESIDTDQKNVVVLLSGCQGDFKGTFRRFCIGEDSIFKPNPNDLVILSSKTIPGNEKKLSLLLNKLSEIGLEIITAHESLVHVSGHPGRNDLLSLFEKYNPTDIVPIHGETFFIRAHIEFIKKSFPRAKTHYLLNFDSLIIEDGFQISIAPGKKLDPIIIHGKNLILEKNKISERRKMACNGVVFISLKLSKRLTEIEKISFTLQGLPQLITDNVDQLNHFLENYMSRQSLKDLEKTAQELKMATRRYLEQILGYKPQTIVHIL